MDRTGLALFLVLALHAALAFRFEPPSVVFGPDPIATIDYDTHYEQTVRALEAFRSAGRTWAYDPHLLAGQVSGAIFDADTKLHELFTIALERLGVPPARGYNLFILLAHLLLAPTIYASARLFRLSRAAATTAVLLASLCWYFDAFSHWVFWVGMISYGFASYAAILPIALFYRYCEDRRPVQIAGVGILLAAIHHLHPYSFFILIVPMALLYLRAFRSLERRHHLAVIGMAVFVLAANLWWLRVALRFWHYVLDSSFYLDATAAYVVYDYLGFLKEPSTTGVMAARTGFRFLALGGATLGLLAWRRARDARYVLFATTLGVLLGVAYFGGYLAPLRQVQPYRFSLPATFLATLPAGAFLCAAAGEVRDLHAGGRLQRPLVLLLGLCIFVGAPRLIRDALYFLPELVPRHARPLPAPPPNINGSIGFGTIQWPEPFDFKHAPIGPDAHAVADFVRAHDDGSGRWLVEWWMLGERLAWATDAQILGGFRELNLGHSDANWFRKYPSGAAPDPAELGKYLERYNVKWVIVSNPTPELESRTDLLTLEATVYGTRVYRTRIASSFLADGPGQVRAELNHLTVRGSKGGDLVLRYHYLETLWCRPACTLYRAEVPGDRVGFIGVRGAPADFEIWNGYR